MAWLKSVDENAGNRDRQLESKPSTYCTMEVGSPDDGLVVEESPALTPYTMGAPSPGELPLLELPETAAAVARDNVVSVSNGAMAAAAAASLVREFEGFPAPPLAWLLAQSMAANMQQAACLAFPKRRWAFARRQGWWQGWRWQARRAREEARA